MYDQCAAARALTAVGRREAAVRRWVGGGYAGAALQAHAPIIVSPAISGGMFNAEEAR